MKTVIKTNLLVILLTPFLCIAYSCSAVKESVCLPLLSCQVKMKLPRNEFRVKKENYEEGIFYTLSDKRGAYIIVFEGALMQYLPEDTLPVLQLLRDGNRTISSGVADSLYWRKDSIGRIRLSYNRVSPNSKKTFDMILNSTRIRDFY